MVEITESITTAKRYHFIFSHAPQAAALEVCLSDKKIQKPNHGRTCEQNLCQPLSPRLPPRNHNSKFSFPDKISAE